MTAFERERAVSAGWALLARVLPLFLRAHQ